uniref:Uncharacterized protein n=1 Tax=Rhizophora mucronata TaxID=61149 RepID=A0A2P2QDR4_RHIMU
MWTELVEEMWASLFFSSFSTSTEALIVNLTTL